MYVQTVPPGGGKWQISNGGGSQPQWRADGKELFYVAPGDTLQAVPVSIGGTFEPGIPKALFKQAMERGPVPRNSWSPSADGQRFVVNVSRDAGQSKPFSVILNWPATLK